MRRAVARRAKGEGSLRRRADGRFEVRLFDPVSGKRRSLLARTEEEAVQRLKAAHRTIDDGVALAEGRLTCRVFFENWLISTKQTVRPSTFRRYEQLLRLHATPHIGNLKLRSLTPTHLRTLYVSLQRRLAPQTVAHVHRVLHSALQQAASDGLIARNVASLVSPPRIPHREMVTLTGGQVAGLTAAAEGHRMAAMFVLAATTGMREGELLGLQWGDCDFTKGTISVRRTLALVRRGNPQYQEPKTASARRKVTLSRTGLAALKAHRACQLAERLESGLWEDRNLVFCDAIGHELDASHFLRDVWAPLRSRAGLPDGFTFHGLRHTAASLSLAAGVPVATVSAMLGHANPSITMRIYAHAVPGTQQLAADAMDRLLGSSGG